jgi:amidase
MGYMVTKSGKKMIDLSLNELATQVQVRPEKAVECVQKYVERIKSLDPTLKSIKVSSFKEASHNAQAIQGALVGSTFIVSEVDNCVQATDALLDEGAQILGELHHGKDPLCLDCDHEQRTPNPWNFEHVSGGASGTCASIIASGGANFSVCDDHCGSLILSGNFCGVYALRPTPQRSCSGWHCRSIADTKLVFEIASGIVEEIPEHKPAFWYIEDLLPYKVDAEIIRNINTCKDIFLSNGCSMQPLSVPIFKNAFTAWVSHWKPCDEYAPQHVTGIMALDAYRHYFKDHPEKGEQIQNMSLDIRTNLTDVLGSNGIIICPAYTSVAPKMAQTQNKPLDFILSAIFAAWELPSINVPTGFSICGLPMGVQLIGAPGTEQNLFVAAEILEREFRGCVRAQPVSLKLPFNPL